MNALATIVELSSYGLQLALVATFYAGLMAGAVLLVNLFLRRWLTAAQMGFLWSLVLLRLLMPIAPSSLLSLESALMPGATVKPNSAVLVGYSAPPLPKDLLPDSARGQQAAPSNPSNGVSWELLLLLLPLAWPCGGAATIVWALTANYLFARKVRRAPICQDQRLLALWYECRRQVGVRRAIPIISFDALPQPAVMGFLRTRLLLPTTAMELDDDQIRMVMLHELAHVKRRDLAVNWVMLVIRAIHWWNPVYWLAASRFSSLREQACDAFVIRQRPGISSRRYSELLLTLVERGTTGSAWRVTLPASILGFLSSYLRRKAVRNRLGAMRRAGLHKSRWQAFGGAVVIVLVSAAGLTEARIPAESEAVVYSSDWLPPTALQRPDAWIEGPENVESAVYAVVYEVRRALDRVIQGGKSEAEARKELGWLVSNELKRPIRIPVPIAAGGSKPAKWPEGSYKIDGDQLIVTASAIRHELLSQNLRAWEQSGLAQISIECRFLTPDHDLATAAGIGWNYVEAFSKVSDDVLPWSAKTDRPPISASASVEDYLPVVSAALDNGRATGLVKSLQGNRRSKVLQAPKVTCFNGQTFHISDVTYTPFVVGIRKTSDGAQQPKIAVVEEGIKLTLRPVLSSDETIVKLDGRIALSEIGKVSQVTSLVGAEPTTIQIPRVKRCSIDISSRVKLDESLLIGCLPHFERHQFFYVLLTVRRADL